MKYRKWKICEFNTFVSSTILQCIYLKKNTSNKFAVMPLCGEKIPLLVTFNFKHRPIFI